MDFLLELVIVLLAPTVMVLISLIYFYASAPGRPVPLRVLAASHGAVATSLYVAA
jgi:hypothetical protein